MGKTKNVRRNKSRGKGRKRNMKGGMDPTILKSLLVAISSVTGTLVENGVKLMSRQDFEQLVTSSGLSSEAITNLNVKGHFTVDPNYCSLASKTCASVASAPVIVVSPDVWKPIDEASLYGNDYLINSADSLNPINLYTRGIKPDWEDDSGDGYYFLNDVPGNTVAPSNDVILKGVKSTLDRALPKVLVSSKVLENGGPNEGGGSRKRRPKTKRRSKRY